MAGNGREEHRVVSLLPSATEIIVQVGGSHLLRGRSHECDYPPEITHLPMLTSANNGHFTNSRDVHDATTSSMVTGRGLYAIDADQLLKIKPTVVVTQSLCSVCSIDLVTVERILRKAKVDPAPIIVNLNPFSIEDVLQGMLSVGSALGLEVQSRAAVEKLQQRVEAASAMAAQLAPAKHSKCAFLEWIDPLFAGGHWTPKLITMAGSSHPLNPPSSPGQAAQPSGVVSPEAVTSLDPDIIIISPCGLDLTTAEEESLAALTDQAWWRDLRAVKEGNVVLVDGNAHFNRPGPRLVDALEFLVGLVNDRFDLIPADFPWKRLHMPELKPTEVARASGQILTYLNAAAAPDLAAGHADRKHLPASCAPDLLPDVEDAHAAACISGSRHYIDPVSGYQVFTEDALRARGYCCGRRCRHCPYGHLRIKASPRLPRINRITKPILLPWCDHPAPLAAHSTDVVLLAVLAGQDMHSMAAKAAQLRAGGVGRQGGRSGCDKCIGQPGARHMVAVVAVDPRSRDCWQSPLAAPAPELPATAGSEACGGTSAPGTAGLDIVMDCCAQLGLPILAVPVYPVPSCQAHPSGNAGANEGSCSSHNPAAAAGVSTCQFVMQQATEVLVHMQRQHLQQHQELMEELGRDSADGGEVASGSLLAPDGNVTDVVSGLAWVPEGEGFLDEAMLPVLPWLHSSGSAQAAQGGGKNGVAMPQGRWTDVAAGLKLPCL